jgi:thioredoxin-related protein
MIDDFNSNPERCLYCNKLHKNWKNEEVCNNCKLKNSLKLWYDGMNGY